MLGAGLAVVLLVNSVWNYVSISRRVVIDQVRRDLWLQVSSVDRTMQRGGVAGTGRLDTLLEQVRQASKGRIAWIQLRAPNGAAIAHAGPDASPVFSTHFIFSRFHNRQPVYKTLETPAGAVVVEALPVRLPATEAFTSLASEDQNLADVPRHMGVIEIAALLDGAGATFWPLRRSLLINSSAAVVLLLTLAMISLRFGSYVEGRQLEQQLDIARRVQQDLLPAARHQISEHFDVAADCVPATRVGGDFYDVFPAAAGGLAFVLGDVSGKGLPAALLTGVIHGAVRSTSWAAGAGLHEAATKNINRLLCERASSERYATMFSSYFDPRTQLLHYINAGHFPPLLLRANHSEAVRLSEGGPVLGMLPSAIYHQGSVRLETGDVLVIYSDGIIETTGEAEEQFGEERLLEAVQFCSNQSAESIRDQILASVNLFDRKAELEDDRTLLVVRRVSGATRDEPSPAEQAFAAAAAWRAQPGTLRAC